jgi:uncharacterized membrane protein
MPDPQLLDRALLLIHVAAGLTALVMAPLAMLVRKGGTAHRRWGKVYFWAMFAIFASSLAVMTYRLNLFLLFIAVLAFYSAFSGCRVLQRKRPQRGRGAAWLDWAGAGLGLGSGGAPAGGAQPRARGPRRGRPERRRRGGATDAHQHLVRRTRHLSSSSSLFASGTCGSILACLA